VVVCIVLPALALAKPKVAIEPLDGDNDGAIVTVVVEQAEHHAKVTGPKATAKKADELNISDAETPKALKKLRIKLGVDMIIHGKVDRSGGKKVLVLTVSGRGKSSTFEVPYKLATSKKFHDELDVELAKRIDPDAEREAQEEDEDEAAAREKERADKDRADKDRADKARADKERADKDREKERDRDKDRDRDSKSHSSHVRTASKDEPDEEVTADTEDHHKKKHHHHLAERNPVTQDAVWLDGGGAGLHRTLTYASEAGGTPPPRVGTGSVSGVIEGEIYPWSFDSLKGGAAGFGFFGSAARTVGLSITVPGTGNSAAINEGAYQAGVRYRFVFGQSSLAIGASYWERHFIADRSGLPVGTVLDMPDVSYTAFAPGAIVKLAAAPKIAAVLAVDVPLVLAAGAITTTNDFRQASVIAFAVEGGADFALAQNYGLRIAGLFDQLKLSFDQPQRGVTAATDRTMGVIASFALVY